jgi:hypothetical protein
MSEVPVRGRGNDAKHPAVTGQEDNKHCHLVVTCITHGKTKQIYHNVGKHLRKSTETGATETVGGLVSTFCGLYEPVLFRFF